MDSEGEDKEELLEPLSHSSDDFAPALLCDIAVLKNAGGTFSA